MYTCICWNIGMTSQHMRDWTLGDTTCSDKIFIKNVTHFTFIRSCDRVLGDLSGQGEARVFQRNSIVFLELPWITTAIRWRWGVVRWFSFPYCNSELISEMAKKKKAMSVSVQSRALFQAMSLLYNIFGTHCFFTPQFHQSWPTFFRKTLYNFTEDKHPAAQQFPALSLLSFQFLHTRPLIRSKY